MNWFLSKFKTNKKDVPLYREFREKGDELNKQKNYEKAMELYIRSYEYSLKETESSFTLLYKIVKTADKIGNMNSNEFHEYFKLIS